MGFSIEQDGTSLSVAIVGHLDLKSSPAIDEALADALDGITYLAVDMAGVDYVSSMGLRLLLSLMKRMSKQGTMVVRHVNGDVMELFDDSGFSQILTIEPDDRPAGER